MKKIASKLFAFGAVALALSACDSKNDVIDNMVYISEATSDTSSDILLGKAGEVTTTSINVRMAQKASTDVKVRLALDPEALAAYNSRNEAEFQMIPSEYVEFPSEVTISAGSATAEVEIKITSFDGEKGVDYAVPISVTGADEAVSTGSNSYLITLGKPLVQMCPGFVSSNNSEMNWEGTTSLSNFTLEWWSRVTNKAGNGGFTINNQAIMSFAANYELYIRFGDVVYADKNGRSLYNFLQIKTMGIDANYDSGDPNNNPLQWGEWIHFAHTYDAGTGDIVLYMNGVEVNRKNGGAGKTFDFTGVTFFGAGSYHQDVIQMAQLRMWKTTRSAAQIAKNMAKEVKYSDPNLVFYLPMNEGEGATELKDVTGNGHDLPIGGGAAYSWAEYTFN